METTKTKSAVLIPSATLVPAELRHTIGSIPVCLFPLQNVTMLERIYEKYLGVTDAVYVAAGPGCGGGI